MASVLPLPTGAGAFPTAADRIDKPTKPGDAVAGEGEN